MLFDESLPVGKAIVPIVVTLNMPVYSVGSYYQGDIQADESIYWLLLTPTVYLC